MAIRFTNSDFTTAARKLGEKVFQDKKLVVEKEVRQFADKLIDKYVPKPLIGALNEYSEWFIDRENRIQVRSDDFNSSIYLDSNKVSPMGARRCMFISNEDYIEAKRIKKRESSISQERNNYVREVESALLNLRTKTRIKEVFPEALEFLPKDEKEQMSSLIPKYEHLRNLIKNVQGEK